jgi:hypothetical protein
MDDYTSNTLTDSKNEWSIILMNHLTPHIIDGFRSIFNESVQLCTENDEEEKYLMTFQNLLARIPKWNQSIIDTEKTRIIQLCNCSYLEDILTCVHIIQLKILSCVRVGSETKKVSIDIPDFSAFIHKTYTNIARKLYSNIYLFEIDIPPLETQKRNREFEHMVQTCIMNTIRDRIPIETLLRQYIDETQEVETVKVEKIVKQEVVEPVRADPVREMTSRPEPVREATVKEATVREAIVRPEPINVPRIKSFEPKDLQEDIFAIPEPMNLSDNEPRINETRMNEIVNEPRIKFSENNSVLTFDSPPDEPITLGEKVYNLDYEVLDLSNTNDSVDLAFEEL